MPSDVVPIRQGGDIIEQVITKGDLAKLTPQERVAYYNHVCNSLGLNPFTRPFEYLTLSGRTVLYARRDAADQLRKINGISIEVVSQKVDDDMLTVHVRASDKTGRSDEDFGVVSIANLKGEARANATLKCITKAKRRVTLSIAGLGFLDETEVDMADAETRALLRGTEVADTTADLDHFAANFDATTGEVEDFPVRDILAVARVEAEYGKARFTAFWQSLSAPERDSIRQHLAEFQAAATTADNPFGLPPLAQPEQQQAAGSPSGSDAGPPLAGTRRRPPPEQQQAVPSTAQPAAGPASDRDPPTDAGQPFAPGDVFAELQHEARAATKDGAAAFAAWWKTLRKSDKELLQMFRGEYDRLAAEADAQRGLSL